MSDQRHDTAPAIGKGGVGYNPYRDKGKFASGPHEKRPGQGGGRAGAAAGHATAARAATTTKARGAIKAAKEAASVARDKPTAANKAKAKTAIAEAGKAAKEAGSNKTSRVPKDASEPTPRGGAKGKPPPHAAPAENHGQMQTEHQHAPHEPVLTGTARLQQAESSHPRSDRDLIDAIGNGGIRDPGGRLVGLTTDAQAAVRGHFDRVAADHGMSFRPESANRVLATRTDEDMGGALGLRHGDGRIELAASTTRGLGYHAQDHAYDSAAAMRPIREHYGVDHGMEAYGMVMHETIHGHGPVLQFDSARPHQFQMAEEMSTEMAARHVTASVHGVQTHDLQVRGYDDIMREATAHLASVSGSSHAEAADALGRAALALKQQSGTMHPNTALSKMATHALHGLGVKSPHAGDDLMRRWSDLSEEFGKRYPWP